LAATLAIGLALAACSHKAPPASNQEAAAPMRASPASGWIANGAVACEKFLTPDLVSRIFAKTDGHAKPLSGQACSYETPEGNSINITLIAAPRASFDADPNTQGATLVGGIGDNAVRTASGIESFKDGKGICQIDVMPPFGNKLSGDALAQAVGVVCNKLFALP
jgi:hypothetical protein